MSFPYVLFVQYRLLKQVQATGCPFKLVLIASDNYVMVVCIG